MEEYKETLEELKDFFDEAFAEQYGTDEIISDKGIEYHDLKSPPRGFILSEHIDLESISFKQYLDEVIEMVRFVDIEEDKPKKFKVKAKPIVFTAEVATYEHEEVLHMLADEGDYILTDDNGERWIIDKDMLEHAYDILE